MSKRALQLESAAAASRRRVTPGVDQTNRAALSGSSLNSSSSSGSSSSSSSYNSGPSTSGSRVHGPSSDTPSSHESLKLIDEANRLVFGHSSLRPGQRDIIVDTLSGVDVFVIMVRLAQ